MPITMQDVIDAKPPRELVSVPAAASVAEAVTVMAQAKIGAVLIKTEDGLVGGIFTERDLLVRVANDARDAAQTPLSLVMTRDVRFVPPTTTLGEALELMTRQRHRHLLVIEGPREHGLVSMGDLVRHLLLQGQAGFEDAMRAAVTPRHDNGDLR